MMLRRFAAAVALSTALAFVVPVGVNAASISSSSVDISVGDLSLSSSNTEIDSDGGRFARVLSSRYNRDIPEYEVVRLRTDFDLGFGDISLAYATAHYSGYPVDEIIHHRHKNMGWGEIAHMYGVSVQDLKRYNHEVTTSARGQGIDITYVEIGNDGRHSHHRDDDRWDRDYRDDRHDRDDRKQESKHDNGHGRGHKK